MPAIAVLVFLATSIVLGSFVPDDAYISFRYAENWAAGNGLVFNPGERVEGYSNFLWIALLALGHMLGLDTILLATALGWLFGLATILVLWLLIRRRLEPWAQILSLVAAASAGPFVMYARSGMETPLFAFLLLLGFLCLERGRLIALAFASAALALCRPEGMLFFPLAVCWSFRNWRAFILPILIFLGLVGGYEIWRTFYFDSLLPTSFIAKSLSGDLVRTWGLNLRNYFFVQDQLNAPVGFYYLTISLVGVAAVLCGSNPFALITAFIFAAGYLNFVDWMPGMRYHAALLPILIFAASPVLSRIGKPRFLLIVALAVLAINLTTFMELRGEARRMEKKESLSLIALGKWLKQSVPTGTIIAISDIGAVSYYSGLPIIDIYSHSLTDSHINKFGWSADYFFSRKPGVVAFVSFSLVEPRFYGRQQSVLNDPRFSEYRLIGKTRSDWYLDRSLWVYARRSIAINEEQLSAFPPGPTLGNWFTAGAAPAS